MKTRIVFYLIILLLPAVSNSQNYEREYRRWSVDASVGFDDASISMGTLNMGRNEFSPMFDFGARYNFNELLALKLQANFAHFNFYNCDCTHEYYALETSAYINFSELLHFQHLNRFTWHVYSGVGVFQLDEFDHGFSVFGGTTLSYDITKRLALYSNVRINFLAGLQNTTAHNTVLEQESFTDEDFGELTFGLTYRFGKKIKKISSSPAPWPNPAPLPIIPVTPVDKEESKDDNAAQLVLIQSQLLKMQEALAISEAKQPACLKEKVEEIILFTYDKSDMWKENIHICYEIATVLNRDTSRRIVIEGRASIEGPVDYNYKLSERRVLSVKRTLLTLGVDEAQIEIRVLGVQQQTYGGDYDLNRSVIVKEVE